MQFIEVIIVMLLSGIMVVLVLDYVNPPPTTATATLSNQVLGTDWNDKQYVGIGNVGLVGDTPLILTSISEAATLTNAQMEELIDINASTETTISTHNSTTTPLSNGATFTGTFENVILYDSVTTAVKTDQNGVLYMDFSPDGTNVDSTLTFTIEAGINEVHRISVTRKYFRLRIYNNSGSDQTYLRASSILGSQTTLTSVNGTNIQSDADTVLTRSIITGAYPNGKYSNVLIDQFSHLGVAVHSPALPYGSIHVENLSPIFQFTGIYNLDPTAVNTYSSYGGSVSVGDSMFSCVTATDNFSNATLQSVKRLVYRPGQGSVMRYTALFTSGASDSNSYQVAGMGHPGDGFYFAYKGSTFGILHNYYGIREIRRLEVTTAATSASQVDFTLNGISSSAPPGYEDSTYSFTFSAAAVGSITRTAWEIAYHTFNNWYTQQEGKYVYFLSGGVGPKTGTYSIAGSSGMAGTFTQTLQGVASTEVFIPQTSWNYDVMDGTGSTSNPSGVLLNPVKLNIYQIGMQWLGAGSVFFDITTSTPGSDPRFHTVHVIENPNELTQPHTRIPNFPFTVSAYKQTSGDTDVLTVKSASIMGAIEGKVIYTGPLLSYNVRNDAVADTAIQILFIVFNSYVFNTKANQSVINLDSLSVSANGQTSAITTVYLIKNCAITGAPSFSQYAAGTSCALYSATTGLTVTSYTNDQLVFSTAISADGQQYANFTVNQILDLQPGEYVCVCARASNATSKVSASLNTREDQ